VPVIDFSVERPITVEKKFAGNIGCQGKSSTYKRNKMMRSMNVCKKNGRGKGSGWCLIGQTLNQKTTRRSRKLERGEGTVDGVAKGMKERANVALYGGRGGLVYLGPTRSQSPDPSW